LLRAFFRKGEDGQPEMVEEFDEYGSPVGGSLSTDCAAELLAEALGEDWVALMKEFAARRTEGFEQVAGEGDADDADEVRAPSFSDEALAIRFASENAEKLRYVASWSKWYVWNGKQWCVDDIKLAFSMVRKECRRAARECNQDSVAKALASAKTVAAVERLAAADQRLAARTEQWDADAWLLNTPGGVIDCAPASFATISQATI
jgi:phage/plasmid-associated DNA primase